MDQHQAEPAGIRWEDPPPRPRDGRSGRWLELLAPLMDHPKRWAIVETRDGPENARTATNNLKARRIKPPPGRWEFAYRSVNGEHRIYARYLGPDEEATS